MDKLQFIRVMVNISFEVQVMVLVTMSFLKTFLYIDLFPLTLIYRVFNLLLIHKTK